jgi:tryptophan synthase alpha chain
LSGISEVLADGRGLVCYLTAGFPSFDESIEHVLACVRGGADVIEIGVPFSDPVADGKVIQLTSQKALEGGMTPAKVFYLVRELKARTEVPIVLMGYYNPIFKMGEESYVGRAVKAGANGLIVPDLPLEESGSLGERCRKGGLDLIQLVGPTTSEERMKHIAAASSGFLYVVSALGTTGARKEMDKNVGTLIGKAKRAAGSLSVGVGFGVSKAEHAEMLYNYGADAAIVGSAILQRIIDGQSPAQIEEMVRSLRKDGR